MVADSQVVITGIGMISPVGIGVDVFWDALISRRSSVAVRSEFADTEHPIRIASEVRDFEPKRFVKPRKALKVMCRPIQFGFAASTMALEQASFADQLNPDRLSTVFGTEAFYADPHEVASVFRKCIVNRCYDHARWGEYAMREIEPLWMLKYLPNMVASHISIACDARGPSNTICQSEASSLLAIIEAADLIRRGCADAVIAGGTGSLMATTGTIYRGMQRLSRNVHRPEEACRPFDVRRDGMVVGEGACAFILERRQAAEARGAPVLASIDSYCRSFHPRNPGFAAAVEANLSDAVARAGLSPADVGHVNANGYSTIEDDIYEAQGIRGALGDVPVICPKSNFGNLGSGTGAVELAASVQACRTGILPPAVNSDQLDERCPINLVREDHVTAHNSSAVCFSFSETGQIVSLVISA